MGTQEEEMSEKTKSIRRWTEVPNPDIKYHTTIASDGLIHNLHLIGRLKGISDTPSRIITVMGDVGPCETCILQPNCSEMCDAKETALVYDMMTRRERT